MLRRYIHHSSVMCSTKKQGMKLCKMLNPKNSRRWLPSESMGISALPTVKSLTKVKYEPDNRGVRRLAMLNKLFMKYITDIMSTGTISINIVGHGIEISKVRVAPDFKTVNVYWLCKGNQSDDETEALLNRSAGPLRQELSTLRLMGEVPYICFVKDKQEAQLVDLDRRLALADYGEDYTPTEIGHLLKSEFMLNMKLSPEVKAKIKQLEEEHTTLQNNAIEDDPIPEMTNDVYGLDHNKIMARLLASRKKSKEAWANLESESPVISYRATEVAPMKIDVRDQKREIAEFLMQRQILQKKLHRERRSKEVINHEHEDVTTEHVEDIDEYCDDYKDEYELETINGHVKQ
ncbi:unnamed protein product [Leptidea sinapis]|uniref:Ribosome-binding factor A n=1 Tax=Leptidea sinapis TaxID=189913 RepID=A0A5E4Q6F0_9NEOP|nr:unnamed protein product [Leptidea sinapis]